jgi:hypothetical protein
VPLLHAACTIWLCYVTVISNIRAKLDSSPGPPGVALQAALALTGMVPDFGGKFGRLRCQCALVNWDSDSDLT